MQSFEPQLAEAARVVADHYARGGERRQVGRLLAAMADGNPAVAEAILSGFGAGWPAAQPPKFSGESTALLTKLLARLSPSGRSQLIALGERWQIADKFSAAAAGQIKKTLLADLTDPKTSDDARVAAARQLAVVGLDDAAVGKIIDAITPKSSPELARDLLETLGQSQSAAVGPAIVKHWASLTPGAHGAAIAVLLSRPTWTRALVGGLEKEQILAGDLSLDQQQKLAQHADRSRLPSGPRRFSPAAAGSPPRTAGKSWMSCCRKPSVTATPPKAN